MRSGGGSIEFWSTGLFITASIHNACYADSRFMRVFNSDGRPPALRPLRGSGARGAIIFALF